MAEVVGLHSVRAAGFKGAAAGGQVRREGLGSRRGSPSWGFTEVGGGGLWECSYRLGKMCSSFLFFFLYGQGMCSSRGKAKLMVGAMSGS